MFENVKRWLKTALTIGYANAIKEAINDTFNNEHASVTTVAIEFTIFLLVMALVLVPIGIKTMLTVNKTDVGIQSGSTTETIFDNIVPIVLVVLLLAIIYMVKVPRGR